MNTKLNKRKYFVGNKKLKNVTLFEEFTNEDTKFGNDFKTEFTNIFHDLNIINILFDKGYLTDAGDMKPGQTRWACLNINHFLVTELGLGARDFFDTNEEVEAFIVNTMESLRQFSNKY